MSSNTVIPRNFDANKVGFSEIKVLEKTGAKQAYVSYDGNFLVMQTPTCTLPYGVGVYDKAGPKKYSLDLSLRGYDSPGKTKHFFDAMSALDSYMISEGVRNSAKWFKKELKREIVEEFYTPIVKYAKDKDGNPKPYPPTVKVTLKQKRDSEEFDLMVLDLDNKPVQYDTIESALPKGSQVGCLIQCTGVWFAGSKYGLSWKVTKARLESVPKSAGNFNFVEDADEFDSPPTKVASVSKVVKAVMEDSEDEEEEETLEEKADEEEEEEEEEVVQPVAAPVKKVVAAPIKKVVAAAVPIKKVVAKAK